MIPGLHQLLHSRVEGNTERREKLLRVDIRITVSAGEGQRGDLAIVDRGRDGFSARFGLFRCGPGLALAPAKDVPGGKCLEPLFSDGRMLTAAESRLISSGNFGIRGIFDSKLTGHAFSAPSNARPILLQAPLLGKSCGGRI